MEKILILNGTISEIPIIKKAQSMGYYVVTSGNMEKLPGHKIANEYIAEDYSDKEAVLKLVKENNIQGIVSCANDFGVITSSYVAENMGWKGHDTYENAVLMHHKDKLMDYFRMHSLPAPYSTIFNSTTEAIDYCQKCQYPIIVKANDLTGGKGIMKANNYEEAVTAINNAYEMSREKIILIEPFLDGVQQSIVVFLVDHKVVVTSSSNIYCMRNPYLVQAETYPAENFDLVKDKLHKIIHYMAEDLDLADGIFSFQYIVQNGIPYVIDMMRRCFGNETLLLADLRTGFPWEEAYIKASLGLDCHNIKFGNIEAEYCGHFGVMAENNGTLVDWSIDPDIKKRVFKTTVNINIGDKINNYLNEKIAHIYFTYDDMKTMNSEIVKYNDRISVKIK